MKLKYNSWHCHIYRAVYSSLLPNNFITYCWKVAVGALFVPFLLPYLALCIFGNARHETRGYNLDIIYSFADRILISTFVWTCLLASWVAGAMLVLALFTMPTWAAFVCWGFGALSLTVFAGCLWLVVEGQRVTASRLQPKNKHAGQFFPQIEWVETK